MTQIESLRKIIIANAPMTHAEMLKETGWKKGYVCSSVNRLIKYGMVKICGNKGTRRAYGPAR